MRIVPTWLGAHEIPLDYRERADGRRAYLDLLVNEMLPVVASEQLARFADVFCEPGVFTVDESREILAAARAAGLGIKLHADELTSGGGAELAGELRATSADHLAAVSDAGIAALAAGGTVATLLPGTMLFLGKTTQAPARRLIDAGVPVALATDFNPGTSPTTNFPLILTLGVSQLRIVRGRSPHRGHGERRGRSWAGGPGWAACPRLLRRSRHLGRQRRARTAILVWRGAMPRIVDARQTLSRP